MTEQRVNILGVGISPINMQLALKRIDTWIANQQRHYVCVSNVHTVMECQRSETLHKALNYAGMVTPDGMPLVWLSQRLGFKGVRRVYGPDLLLAVCSASRKYRHFFYGGAEGVSDTLSKKLQQQYPGLEVAGTYCPPFRELAATEKRKIIHTINDAEPDIVWVGLGAPKQELWMWEYRPYLNAPVLIGIGAAFDFHSGRKQQAPSFLQKHGLEWAFRLLSEPRRLWKRYLINNPVFMLLALAQQLKLRTYPEPCYTEKA